MNENYYQQLDFLPKKIRIFFIANLWCLTYKLRKSFYLFLPDSIGEEEIINFLKLFFPLLICRHRNQGLQVLSAEINQGLTDQARGKVESCFYVEILDIPFSAEFLVCPVFAIVREKNDCQDYLAKLNEIPFLSFSLRVKILE